MKHSTNYNLNKPDYVDQYDLRHWNDNTDIIDSQMKSEETSRIQSDATLQQNIANEASARQGADTTLQGNINDEVNARTNADTQIRNDISDGTLVAKKAQQAQQDEDGSIIKDTYQKKSNKVTSWSSPTSNDNYPSEKLVKDSLDEAVSSMKLTKIWENPNPNSAYTATSFTDRISLNNASEFIIEYSLSVDSSEIHWSNVRMMAHFKLSPNSISLSESLSGNISHMSVGNGVQYVSCMSRGIRLSGGTSNKVTHISFANCYLWKPNQSVTVENTLLVPQVIYRVGHIYNE